MNLLLPIRIAFEMTIGLIAIPFKVFSLAVEVVNPIKEYK